MTTVVTGTSVVPHHIVTTLRNCDRWICLVIASIGPHILLLELITVDVDCACTHLDCITRKTNHPFDKRLFPILRIPEHHYIMAFYLAETIEELGAIGVVTDATEIIASHISLASVPPHDQVAADVALRGITLAYDGMIWKTRS